MRLLGRISAGTGRMRDIQSRSVARRIATLLAIFALGAAISSCSRTEAPATPAPGAGGAAAETEIEVRTVPVRRGAIVQRIEAPGTLEAKRESKIGAEVQGRIDRVFVDEGDRVETGAPLFQIDREPYEMGLRQAQAALEHTRAEKRQVEADLARARELQKQNIVPAQQIEKLETGLAVARAGEAQAVQALALAQHKLDRTLVTAPYAASIVARLADEGTTVLVQPQTIVVVVQESGELEARATIPESRLSLVRVGDPALIHVEGMPAPIQTEVQAVADAIDPASRTYTVRMQVANPDHALKAGVFARIEIVPQSKRDVLIVPRAAIRSEEGLSRVFTVRDGRATPVPITLGAVSETEVEVIDGLRVDTRVIVDEAEQHLAPGMRVREARAAAATAGEP
jgi:membrane fusion protein (multidrug efflux system)